MEQWRGQFKLLFGISQYKQQMQKPITGHGSSSLCNDIFITCPANQPLSWSLGGNFAVLEIFWGWWRGKVWGPYTPPLKLQGFGTCPSCAPPRNPGDMGALTPDYTGIFKVSILGTVQNSCLCTASSHRLQTMFWEKSG